MIICHAAEKIPTLQSWKVTRVQPMPSNQAIATWVSTIFGPLKAWHAEPKRPPVAQNCKNKKKHFLQKCHGNQTPYLYQEMPPKNV